ncbi:MAG: DUF4158 domain-containing protein [Neisseriaceae bacterium]
MKNRKEHLEILTLAERAAYYEVPDFNEEQCYEFLTLTQNELELAMSRNSWSARVYCCLQIAYFKAVKLFFKVTWSEVSDKTFTFILEQYFFNQNINLDKVTNYEHYTQCAAIAKSYGFQMWQSQFRDIILNNSCYAVM